MLFTFIHDSVTQHSFCKGYQYTAMATDVLQWLPTYCNGDVLQNGYQHFTKWLPTFYKMATNVLQYGYQRFYKMATDVFTKWLLTFLQNGY